MFGEIPATPTPLPNCCGFVPPKFELGHVHVSNQQETGVEEASRYHVVLCRDVVDHDTGRNVEEDRLVFCGFVPVASLLPLVWEFIGTEGWQDDKVPERGYAAADLPHLLSEVIPSE